MKRNLFLLTTCVALLALSIGACKKKPKEQKAAEGGMQAMDVTMEVMASSMKAMDAPMKAAKVAAAAMEPAAKGAAMEPAAKGAAKAAAPGATGEIKITKKALTAGTKIGTSAKTNMHFTLEIQGKKIKFVNESNDVRQEEILAVKGSAVTKLKVLFKTQHEAGSQGGKSRSKTSPLQGKTFVLEAKGGKVIVTDDKGKPVDAPTVKAVTKKYKTFGTPDKMFDAIPTTAIKVGARVASIEKALQESIKEEMGGDKGEKITTSNVSVVLKEIKGKLALFAVTMTITIKKGAKFSIVMRTVGVVSVDSTTGHEVAMKFSGPLDVMGKKNNGHMTRIESKTYSR